MTEGMFREEKRQFTTTYGYQPFGVELPPYNESASNSHKFTGHERDTMSGYDYMHFRYYASTMGRFMKPDNVTGSPLNPQNRNLYSYVRGNPVNFSDPTGHQGEKQATLPDQKTGEAVKEAKKQIKEEQTGNKDKPLEGAGDELKLKTDPKLTLIAAQNTAMITSSFQPGSQTHCNEATISIAKDVGAPLGPLTDKYGNALLANIIAKNLSTSKEYFEVGPILAQALANSGMLVIAAQSNPGGHGHVATVRPEGIPGDVIKGGTSGPLIANIGRRVGVMYAHGMDVEKQPGAFRKNPMEHYYLPATRQ